MLVKFPYLCLPIFQREIRAFSKKFGAELKVAS